MFKREGRGRGGGSLSKLSINDDHNNEGGSFRLGSSAKNYRTLVIAVTRLSPAKVAQEIKTGPMSLTKWSTSCEVSWLFAVH